VSLIAAVVEVTVSLLLILHEAPVRLTDRKTRHLFFGFIIGSPFASDRLSSFVFQLFQQLLVLLQNRWDTEKIVPSLELEAED
jgi:hypothetical protein